MNSATINDCNGTPATYGDTVTLKLTGETGTIITRGYIKWGIELADGRVLLARMEWFEKSNQKTN